MKMKIFMLATCFFVAGSATAGKVKSPRLKADIVFVGTVLKLGTPVPPTGVLTHYRLAQYRIESLCKGRYSDAEIVVDHFSLTGRELEGIKVGDRVFVAVDRSKGILVRHDVEGIRSPDDEVKFFYIGGGVAPPKPSPGNCLEGAAEGFRLNYQRIK